MLAQLAFRHFEIPLIIWMCSIYLSARHTGAEGWRLKIDCESSKESVTLPSLAALWHFPINTERKRKSQLRFDSSNVWQCRSRHTTSAVIFYTSVTLHILYPYCVRVCTWACVDLTRAAEARGPRYVCMCCKYVRWRQRKSICWILMHLCLLL